MKKKIFLATQNKGKIERYKKLLAWVDPTIEISTPKDFGLEGLEIEEAGATLAENAEIKVRAYFGKVDLPLLANDTGFWVEGEGLINAPKRIALRDKDEKQLTKAEIASSLVAFWKDIARKHGGKVNAAWVETFIRLDPDGTMHRADARREIFLTDQEFGAVHIELPVRTLYISKVTNKPPAQHNEEDERLELKPVTDALIKVLS
jgi:Ham1 family protein